MGYSWYRVDSSFTQHPKTLALQARLNEPLADAYVNRLWSWVHRYAPAGVIPSRVTTQIEVALGWVGARGTLLEALTEVGFLEVVSDGLEVHDWADHQAFWAEKAKKDAAMKRQRRRRAVTQSVTHPSRVTAPPTDGRTDKTDVTEQHTAPRKQREPPDARWKPLIEQLQQAFKDSTGQTYRFQGPKDGSGLKRLLATEAPEEILRRWRVGLKGEGWRHTATVAQLASKWNDLAATPPSKGAINTTTADWASRPKSFEEELADGL